MAPRSARSPRREMRILVIAACCWIVYACSSSSQTPSPSASHPASASLTPVPGGSNPPGQPTSAEPPTQTDTEWGRIWDALPPSFPLPQGSVPTETGEGPVSASVAVGASAEQASQLVQAGLLQAGYSIGSISGPFEDGSRVIDAVGAAQDCRVQVRLTPLSGTTHMAVMFGAGCPFD